MRTAIPEAEYERDRELVLRCQGGDDAAFGQLYELHYERLRRWCRARMTDAHAAEEVAQDAFVRAFLALHNFGGERHFFAWLTVISRRLMIDRYRRDRRVRVDAVVPGAGDRAAEEVVLDRLDGEQLRVALGRVRPRHRAVLQLREWEGLSYEAIAERLGVTRATVPPLLHRARVALRREYLAVAQAKSHALVAGWLAVGLAPLRRLRQRLLQALSQLPDASALAPPAAALALGLGALTGSVIDSLVPRYSAGSPTGAAVRLGATAATSAPLSGSGVIGGAGSVHHPHDQSHTWRGRKVLNGMVFMPADEESAEADRRRIREHMTYSYEIGEFYVGVNPDAAREDIAATGRGDARWIDGRHSNASCRPAPTRPCAPDARSWELVEEY